MSTNETNQLTVETLRGWFKRGQAEKAEFMLVVCDTFDYSDYPVFVKAEEFNATHAEFERRDMQRIMEVYDLSMDCEQQMSERRAFNCPVGFAR